MPVGHVPGRYYTRLGRVHDCVHRNHPAATTSSLLPYYYQLHHLNVQAEEEGPFPGDQLYLLQEEVRLYYDCHRDPHLHHTQLPRLSGHPARGDTKHWNLQVRTETRLYLPIEHDKHLHPTLTCCLLCWNKRCHQPPHLLLSLQRFPEILQESIIEFIEEVISQHYQQDGF